MTRTKLTEFACFIREAREDKGLTLTAAAEAVGCTKSYLSDLENAKVTNPTIQTLVDVARALDLYLDDLAMTAAVSLPKRRKALLGRDGAGHE